MNNTKRNCDVIEVFVKKKYGIKLTEDDEKLYAQSGYFYPSQMTTTNSEKDGMDSLVAFGSFQKLKFGL